MKLDQATLHLITGPIHFIEAVTGWHLWAKVQTVGKDVIDIIKKSYDNITKHIKDLIGHTNQRDTTLADIGNKLKTA